MLATNVFIPYALLRSYARFCQTSAKEKRCNPQKKITTLSKPYSILTDTSYLPSVSTSAISFAVALTNRKPVRRCRTQILDALGEDDIEALRARAKALWFENSWDDGRVTSLLANSLWLKDGVKYEQTTMDRLAADYFASSYSGEMGSEAYNEALRSWINKNTGDLLERALHPAQPRRAGEGRARRVERIPNSLKEKNHVIFLQCQGGAVPPVDHAADGGAGRGVWRTALLQHVHWLRRPSRDREPRRAP